MVWPVPLGQARDSLPSSWVGHDLNPGKPAISAVGVLDGGSASDARGISGEGGSGAGDDGEVRIERALCFLRTCLFFLLFLPEQVSVAAFHTTGNPPSFLGQASSNIRSMMFCATCPGTWSRALYFSRERRYAATPATSGAAVSAARSVVLTGDQSAVNIPAEVPDTMLVSSRVLPAQTTPIPGAVILNWGPPWLNAAVSPSLSTAPTVMIGRNAASKPG
jgi:hypothetical protein